MGGFPFFFSCCETYISNCSAFILFFWRIDLNALPCVPFSTIPLAHDSPGFPTIWSLAIERNFSCICVSVATSLQLIWKVSSCPSNRVTDVADPLLAGKRAGAGSNALCRSAVIIAAPTGTAVLKRDC